MSTITLASASPRKTFAAEPGLSGMLLMMTLAWSLSAAMPRTTTCSMYATSSFTMVPGLWLNEERTSKTTPNFLANSTDRDCITLEPDEASSSISS